MDNQARHPEKLKQTARRYREDILLMNHMAGSGHPGVALSCTDICTYLFFQEMNFGPENMDSPDRDRFIMSKGHSCMALYAALAEKGIFPKEWYSELRHTNGRLQGHPDRVKTPGVEFNSGSLGQGFSFSCGVALGAKRSGSPSRTYCVLGDGEINEGQVWEALAFAAHWRLDNLVAILDNNGLQSDAPNEEILNMQPIGEKISAFGWNVIEIGGHDFAQIRTALGEARATKGKPTFVWAHTVKGKGVSFMEGDPKWHGSLAPSEEELEVALQEVRRG